jgi:RNA polymerase sigma-70 factor (ECF subfamily)
LRQILANTLAGAVRQYGGAGRDVALERSLQEAVADAPARLEALLRSETASPCGQAVRQEEFLRLAEGLARLPEDQRTAVELHHLQGCPVAEVAGQMGRTEASVAGLRRRGLKKLRELLQERK